MTGRRKWKIVLEYMAGILILGISLTLAWFLPGWYGDWQNERLMKQVELSSREEIEFLDIDSLDIAGRLKMLQETRYFDWTIEYDGMDIYAGNMDFDVLLARCQKSIDQWCENGLLPDECSKWVREGYLGLQINAVIYTEKSTLPVIVFEFEANDSNLLIIVMDMEKDMIYFASASGPYVMDKMAENLGYADYVSMRSQVLEGKELWQEPDTSGYDFAGVCGAEAAEITGYPQKLELNAKLKFDTFEGWAKRDVIRSETGYGTAVLYGTESWHEFVMGVMGEYNIWEYPVDTDVWMKDILMEETGEKIQE